MSVTLSSLFTNFNTYVGDSSTDRISDAERYQYLTEATIWLMESLGNEHQDVTYDFDYYDTVNYYDVTGVLPDLTEAVDLRAEAGKNYNPFTYKSGKELSVEIANKAMEPSYSIERHNKDAFLVVNYQPVKRAAQISSFDSLTADGGTWEADTSTSDATSLALDTIEYKEGSASFKFNVDVSQSGNNRATIQNTTLTSRDFSDYEDLAAWFFWVYIPDETYFSSVTLFWGSDTSNYWSATATTDYNNNAWVEGWNRVKVVWSAATATGTPDSSAVDYIRVDYNYTGSQTDDNNFRLDDLKLIIPEQLTFYYTTWNVGANSSGTGLTAFTASTDVPFFSAQYDGYRYAVAHKAASLAFYNLRLKEDGASEEVEAIKAFNRQKKMFPISKVQETRSFKPVGVNFRRRRYGQFRGSIRD